MQGQALSRLKQSDLLEGGQVDVHSDGGSHHQGHLIQQLRLIWEGREETRAPIKVRVSTVEKPARVSKILLSHR